MYKLIEDINIAVEEGPYLFNGNYVPRVTHILSILGEDALMGWANHLGFKRQNYKQVVQRSADIGTHVHNAIENYLNDGTILDLTQIDSGLRYEVSNGFNSFMLWWERINKNKDIEVVFLERPLICQYYGGTCDILMKFKGRYFLGDWKTSNNIGYKYFLQLAAYKAILESEGFKIDGCFILQVSKKEINYNEFSLDFLIPDNLQFINDCKRAFDSLLYTYYNKMYIMEQFKKTF